MMKRGATGGRGGGQKVSHFTKSVTLEKERKKKKHEQRKGQSKAS